MQKIEFYIGTIGQDGSTVHTGQKAEALLSILFGAYTKTPGVGFWEGQREDCFVYTIFAEGDKHSPATVRGIAETLAKLEDQQSVFWTLQFITGGLSGGV